MNEVIENLSKELGLPVDIISKTYSTYWRTIKKHIESIPLKESGIENLSDEEFKNLKTNINIPSLGKMYVTKDKVIKAKKQLEYIRMIKNNYESSKGIKSKTTV
jgi:hypothetical protein